MSFETLTFDIDDEGVARVTLDRPPANALDPTMAEELRHVAIRCATDPNVGCVVVGSTGKVFFGGGDLSSFADATNTAAHLQEITVDFHAALARFSSMDAPLVARVQGPAGGAGMSFVAAADLVVASEAASFSMSYTRVGLTPDGASTYYLSRVVGLRRAMDLVLTNRTLSAEEAEAWGLVNRVVAADDLDTTVNELAGSLAAGSTGALGAAKRLLIENAHSALETAMEREAVSIARQSATPDGREGVAAFLEKRRPTFGR